MSEEKKIVRGIEEKIVRGIVVFSVLSLILSFIIALSGKKPDMEGTDGAGNTHLMRAVRSGEHEIAKKLLSHGAKVNARNKAGWTPIMYAANDADVKIIRLLLKYGAEINNPPGSATSPLHLAIHTETEKDFLYQLQAIKVLLENGANVGFTDEHKETPIMAATRGRPAEVKEIVRELKESRADINAISGGYTALSFAIHIAEDDEAAQEMAATLIDAGADINISTGITALMAAVVGDFPKTAGFLISKGAKKELTNTDNATALDTAVALNQKKEFIKLLE